jgi:hypothetical protein
MDASADLDAQCLDVNAQGLRAADGLRRAVERGQVAVAGVLHHRAAESLREVGGDLTKAVQHRTPPLVAGRRRVLRRRDHVGEQDSAQGAMGRRRCRTTAGEELLDPGQDPVGLGEPGRGVHAVDVEVPRAGDVVGKVAAALHRNDFVAGMNNEGGRGDRRRDRPHVDPKRRFE